MEHKEEEKASSGAGWFERSRRDIRMQDDRQVYTGMGRSREDALSAWLGPERTASVFADLRPMHDDPGAMVDELLKDFSNADAVMLSRLDAEWMSIFEASIARLCRPLSVKGGQLQIEVNDNTVLYVFEHQKREEFLRHLSAFSGGSLKSISFVVSGKRSFRRWAGGGAK